MAIHTSLRQFLIASNAFPNIGDMNRIQYSKIDQKAPLPVIWFQRSGGSTTPFANGDKMYPTDTFDMAIVTEKPGAVFAGPAVCQDLTKRTRSFLDAYLGRLWARVIAW